MNQDAKEWIPKPCHLNWEDLNQDEKMEQGHTARLCDECEHHVHDLTGMSPEQIIQLKETTEAAGHQLCGMLPSTKQAEENKASQKLRKVTLASLASLAPLAFAACADTPTQHRNPSPTLPAIPPANPFPSSSPPAYKPPSPTEKNYPKFSPGMVGLIAEPQ